MQSRKMKSTAAGILSAQLLVLVPVLLWSQGTGGSGGATSPAPTPAPSPGPSTPSTPSPSIPNTRTPSLPTAPTQPQQPTFPEFRRPIFLSGKVVYDDGTPADNVTIERVCNGIVRPEAYTNSKGQFSFQLGRGNMVVMDASVNMNDSLGLDPTSSNRSSSGMMGNPEFSERDLIGCEIRASMAGFTSEPISLAGRRIMDNPDLGTIFLRRLANVKGFTVSVADASAPKDAKKAFEKALKEKANRKPDKAMKELEKALKIHPNYASAWHEMGLLYFAQNNADMAKQCFEKALAADERFVAPLVPLAALAYGRNDFQQTLELTSKAISLNPYLPMAYFYQSMAHVRLQQFTEAEKDAQEMIKLDPNRKIPKIYHILGVAQANQGEFQEALENMRRYIEYAPKAQDAELVKDQIRRLESTLAQAARPQP